MSQRPELHQGCVEFVAPAEYMVRPPQAPVYMFVLDVSPQAQANGSVQAAVDVIDGAALLDVDCAEYPCIAHIDVPPGGQDDMDAFVTPLSDALSPGEDDPGLMVMMSETDDGTGPMATLSVALAVEAADGPDPRIEGRVRDFLDASAP